VPSGDSSAATARVISSTRCLASSRVLTVSNATKTPAAIMEVTAIARPVREMVKNGLGTGVSRFCLTLSMKGFSAELNPPPPTPDASVDRIKVSMMTGKLPA
jgi:hypothetical protein